VLNIRIYLIESSHKIKDFLENWNISVHLWLKHYVFLRMLKKPAQNSQGNQSRPPRQNMLQPILITFLVSAIWHGFYPGYFFFFVCAGLNDYMFKIAAKIYILFEWMPFPLVKIIL
jgi:lysophospholipid acyltransferase